MLLLLAQQSLTETKLSVSLNLGVLKIMHIWDLKQEWLMNFNQISLDSFKNVLISNKNSCVRIACPFFSVPNMHVYITPGVRGLKT